MSELSDNNASDSVSPIGGRRKKEGNDSLWKRARRTLGTNSLTFLQPQNKPSASKAADGSGPSKTTPGKRREQVRHAQRTHRQRTQNYIKALESEVIRLRGSEGDLMQENKKLQNQVDSLLSTLNQANIPLPAEFEGSLESPQPTTLDIDMPTTISYKADNLNHQRLHVDWPGAYTGTQASPAQATVAHRASPTDHFDSDWDISGSQHKPLPNLPQGFSLATLSFKPTSENPMRVAAPNTLDTAEVAIDFVLALEHPCMSHLPHPTNPPSQDPSNHALLISTHLMSRAPRPPQPDSSWTANGSILRQLLNLSSAINLEGEITPVEAWHRLRQHPGSTTLDKSTVERIKGDLSTIVRCYGYETGCNSRLT
ncbi:MAG: hypothetical protein Q9201_001981 [Fulgogasparrea decipioides]